MWDRGLQGKKTIIQRQQRVTPKGDDHRLLRFGQDRGARLLRAGLQILDRRPLAPLRNRLGVDPQLPAQFRERSLRSLYCSSDGVRGRGAAMANLSHSASFHSCERITPANRGIKHLGCPCFFPLFQSRVTVESAATSVIYTQEDVGQGDRKRRL